MKTEGLRLLGGIKKLKKLWIIIMVIVLLIVSTGIFIFKDFGFGYRYYEFNQQASIEITVGYSKEQKNILSIMDEYLKQLESEGYYVASCQLEQDIYSKAAIIPKHKINDEEIKQKIIDNLNIEIFCKKVIINDDIYYFKNEEDKKIFIDELNSIKETQYDSEEVIENILNLTNQETLDKKVEGLKKEKEEEERQRKLEQEKKLEEQRKQQVTSRSSSSISREEQNSSYSGGIPLASYTYISSYYGQRNGRMHTGVDFAAPAGTHIYAWKDGTVIQASWSGGYGNFVVIQHNDGTVSRYGHLSGYACSAGQEVSEGQVIGYVGTTGHSTGNHLHFEIKINGDFVNPLNYL